MLRASLSSRKRSAQRQRREGVRDRYPKGHDTGVLRWHGGKAIEPARTHNHDTQNSKSPSKEPHSSIGKINDQSGSQSKFTAWLEVQDKENANAKKEKKGIKGEREGRGNLKRASKKGKEGSESKGRTKGRYRSKTYRSKSWGNGKRRPPPRAPSVHLVTGKRPKPARATVPARRLAGGRPLAVSRHRGGTQQVSLMQCNQQACNTHIMEIQSVALLHLQGAYRQAPKRDCFKSGPHGSGRVG